jgi:hypothetical protein
MKVFVSSIILLLTLFQSAYSLDTNVVKYFPLRLNNSWTYYYESSSIPYHQYRYRVTVLDSLFINGNIYYKVYTQRPYSGNITETLRVNPNDGNLLKYSVNYSCPWLQNESLIDSLASRFNDSAKIGCTLFFRCTDTANHNVFGFIRPHKSFVYSAFENYHIKTYAKDFGLVYQGGSGGVGGDHSALIGCTINGILYGDTSLVGIESFSSGAPKDFSLSQNFPNPFNPITKIKFSIPPLKGARGMIRLVIYDILGREIATLVNELLQPGTYEVEWDGSNYPSGVYFYKLITDDYTETRKMVLIK